nr:ribosome maturation factor RimM [Solimonas terrae]
MGRVSGVFGIKGWIRVHSYTRPPENILNYRRWWLHHGGGFEAKVLASQVQNRSLVVQLSDAAGLAIEDREVAAGLVGAEIAVDRDALPKLGDGEYYWIDLIGLRVESLEGAALGTVTDVTSNGAQDVLVLGAGEVERMIPVVRPQIVREIDMAAGRIVCDWQPDW